MWQDFFIGGGEIYLLVDFFKQWDGKFLFQLLDMKSYGGLSVVQFLCCVQKGIFFDNSFEGDEVLQIYIFFLY